MKRILVFLLAMIMILGVAAAENGAQTRVREITIGGETKTETETRYEDASGYVLWLPEGWSRVPGEEEDALGVFAPSDNADVSLTVAPVGLDVGDDLLDEAAGDSADGGAQVSERQTVVLDNGKACDMVEARKDGTVYRYYLVKGETMAACITAQFPEGVEESFGARLENIVKSMEFVG